MARFNRLPRVMPPTRRAFAVADFSPGLDMGRNKTRVAPGFATRMANCDVDTGALARSRGSRRLAQGNTPVKSLAKFYPQLSGGVMLAMGEEHISRVENGALVPIAGNMNGGAYDYIGYQIGDEDIIILTNGKDPMKKWDGQTLSDLANAPKATAIELHRERVWVIPADNPIAVQCSDDLNPENWDMHIDAGALILLPTWDGTKNTGLKAVFDDILVTKERSIWKIWGSDPSNYQVAPVFTGRGAVANRSLCVCDNVMAFLSGDAVMVYDGVSALPLATERIAPYIKRLNQQAVAGACAAFFERKYYLAVPLDDSPVNNAVFIYHFGTGAWTVREGVQANDFLEMDGALYAGGEDGAVRRMEYGGDEDGAPVASLWEGGLWGAGQMHMKKDLRRLRLTGRGTPGEALLVTLVLDEKTEVTYPVPLTEKTETHSLPIHGRCRLLTVRVQNRRGADFSLSSLQVEFVPLERN